MSEGRICELDRVLSQFSVFGRYHSTFIFLALFAFALNSIYCINYVFVAEEVGYRCKDQDFGNDTCNGGNTTECTEWVYDNPNSFMAEFGLACQEWKRTLIGTMHSFGYMVGLLFVGPLSDRLGRKLTVVILGVLGGVIGIARSFTTWYWLYVALEFLEGAIGDNCSPMFILIIELVSSKNRVLFYTLTGIGFPLGGCILPLAAWTFPYWRTLLQVIYAPALLFFVYLYAIDESPRWLLTKGKKDKAVRIIENAANQNKIKIDKAALDKLEYVKDKSVNVLELLKITFSSKTILLRFLVCVVWWTTSTFVNYGMSINSVSLQGNKYINYALTTLMDAPSNLIIFYALKYFNRKISLISSFIAGAFFCIAQAFLPTNLPWLSILVNLIGKMMSSFYFGLTYIYTSELFPTYTRNSMHALCSSLGRIGSIIAPQTPLLLHYWYGLPSLVFGGVSLLAGLTTFLVPDTSNDSLPDTVHQAEELGKKKPDVIKNSPLDFVIYAEDKDKHCSRL